MENDLFAYYLAHLDKEEKTILPVMWRHFTDERLIAILTTVERNTSPDRYAEWMSWMFQSLNANKLAGMFAGMKKGAPPPFLEGMVDIEVKSVPEERWKIVKEGARL